MGLEGPEAKQRHSVLAVDDESANLAVLNRILSADYSMHTAKSGAQALQLVAGVRPNLILLDVVMPDMSGFDVLAKLKESPETRDIPVIFITGLVGPDDEEKGFALGAVDYITKPFKPIVVKARVRAHMKNATRLNMVEDDLIRISSIVEGSPQFVLYMNTTTGAIEYMNPAIAEISGYTREEIAEKGLGLMLDEETLRRLREEYLPSVSERRRLEFEMPVRRKDGETRIFAVSAFAAVLHGGETGVGITAKDETELKKMQRELVDARERTERALLEAEFYNRAKSDFLSRMSHEMRTPMNAIIGMTAIAGTAADEGQRKYSLDRVDEAAHHLLSIIDDVLDMAQIDTGKFELSAREFSFGEMMRTVSDAISPAAAAKGLDFSVSLDEGIPDSLVADDRRLRQVLANLLSNAVKYTPEKGRVRLSAKRVGTDEEDKNSGECAIRFEVSDTGIGISEEQRARLFRAFEQADNSITREHGGIGLGLAITRHIVGMMNGNIQVESEPGRGSRFICSVRAGRPKIPEAESRATPDESSEAANLAGRRILLTDDVPINREIVVILLGDTGASIDCAKDGFEALKKFCEREGGYDLLLMDLHMPGMDGFEATRRIRASGMPGAESVPIIAVTADTGAEAIELCARAGMDAHIGKPVEYDVLVDTITRCLRKRS
ncbi:MAG: response regulator [Synergistaceae bacterium]|jgi:PAS domain S-box-containing protein|nr:response regulator [Synergistaceae bacterium]